MKRTLLFLSAATAVANLFATDIKVTNFRHTGPFAMPKPVMVDTVGFTNDKFTTESLLDVAINLDKAKDGTPYIGVFAPKGGNEPAIHLLYFTVQNTSYAKAKISVGKMKHMRLFVDGKQTASGAETALEPTTHNVVIKYISQKDDNDSLQVSISSDNPTLSVGDGSQTRRLTMADVMGGKRAYGADISPDGRFLITTTYETTPDGKTKWRWRVSEVKTGRTITETSDNISWIPGTNSYQLTRQGSHGRELVAVNVTDGSETILAQNLPEGSLSLSPTGKFAILTKLEKAPTDDKDVHEIVNPDDRQPGWRDRSSLHYLDLATGVSRPLTYGFHGAGLQDISTDGRYILFSTMRKRMTQRPTTLLSLYRLDLTTMAVDTIVAADGFVSSALLSPDGKQIALKGSPECLAGIGKNVPEGRIPNVYDYQLYILNIADGKTMAITKYFNPSIEDFSWSRYDGKLYFTALDKDYTHLYRADAKTGKIEQLPTPEDLVQAFSTADSAPVMAWYGKSASNADRIYTLNTANRKSTLVSDLSAPRLDGIELGDCRAWDFISQRGDTISGRYYLPPHFDATKSYPLIVYYYGGCSPTSRNFDGQYPPHAYAAQDYVVYVVNPSGAAGFGQEFSSRHVNTAGKGVAEDIIEGTKKFVAEHKYVDGKKIGCVGASYGGFMTQYLQTQTDLFAAAVSHAGISDHTSYWGEGYWGYSYSEVSMAGSYPWKDKQLYVDQSPLYNADKINTPLLFLHGTADTNVPIGESIQMFTALKLLGKETAFIEVEGENHGIRNYQKRMKWQNSIFAWFAKWLKDDPTWWNALYKPKNL